MVGISIIIPVYNVKQWLKESLDSIRNQTYPDWEAVCIDDGSTDGSFEVLQEYAKEDARFKVFRRKHSNAGAVRNFGMKQASGEYLIFLDADDVFSPWLLVTLQQGIVRFNADIAACGFLRFTDGQCLPEFKCPKDVKWRDETFAGELAHSPFDAIGTMPWNKLVRRQFVEREGIQFLEQSSTNDLTFEALSIALSRKSVVTDCALVAYRQRKGSIQSKKSKQPQNYFRAINAFLSELNTRNKLKFMSDKQKQWLVEVCVGGAIFELRTQTTYAAYQEVRKALKSFGSTWVMTDYSTQRHEKYFARLPLRFRRLLEGGAFEEFWTFCEGHLAVLVGNAERGSSVRRAFSGFMKRIVTSFFESPKLPWNR